MKNGTVGKCSISFSHNLLWFLSVFAIFFELYRQFMSYSIFFKGYVYILLWFIVCIVFAWKFVSRIKYSAFIVFFITAVIYLLRGGKYQNLDTPVDLIVLVEYFVIIPTISLFYCKYCTTRQKTISIIVVFLIMTYTMICTAPVALIQPEIIRETASDEDLNIQLQQLGVMNYALAHGVAFLTPAFCFGIKYCRSIFIKIFCLLGFSEVLFIIYLGGATTPLLLAVFSFFLALVYNVKKSPQTNLIRIGIITLLLLILTSDTVVLFILDSIEPIINGTAFEQKANELRLSLAYGSISGGGVEERESMITNTFNAFFTNPIFGTAESKLLGCHNYLLDIMASVGLVGFIPLVVYLFYIIRTIYYALSRYTRYYYLMGIGCFILMIFTKNVNGSEFFVYSLLLLPCILTILENNTSFKTDK